MNCANELIYPISTAQKLCLATHRMPFCNRILMKQYFRLMIDFIWTFCFGIIVFISIAGNVSVLWIILGKRIVCSRFFLMLPQLFMINMVRWAGVLVPILGHVRVRIAFTRISFRTDKEIYFRGQTRGQKGF